MMSWWHYLLLVNLYLVLFFAFYMLLLRRETFFQLNRVYLVAGSMLSFLIPLMQSDWINNLFITQKVHSTIYARVNPAFIYQVKPVQSPLTLGELLTYIYIIGAVLLLARLLYQLVLLKKLINKVEVTTAFSFFRKIRVDESLPNKQTIIEHEQVHISQWHSADVLFIEAVMIINWFNPVVYFYRKAIKHVHEFIADRKAIQTGTPKAEYALMLLTQTFGADTHQLANNFFNHSLLKQRIMMLNQNESGRRALLKYGLSAPLFAAMLIFSSATVNRSTIINIINKKADQALSINTTQLDQQVSTWDDVATGRNDKKKTIIVQVQSLPEAKNLNAASAGSKLINVNIDSMAERERKPVFNAVEVNPTFPGGETAFAKFLHDNIHYPSLAKDKGTTGRVFATFVVEKDGSLNDMRLLRDPGDGLGDEALRVLNMSPKWSPGIQNGKTVRVQYTVPVNFSMVDDERQKPKTVDTVTAEKKTAFFKANIHLMLKSPSDTLNRIAFNMVRGGRQYNNAALEPDRIKIIMLNGKPITYDEINNLDPANIKSVQVFSKDTMTNKSPVKKLIIIQNVKKP